VTNNVQSIVVALSIVTSPAILAEPIKLLSPVTSKIPDADRKGAFVTVNFCISAKLVLTVSRPDTHVGVT